jgi:ribonucleoside-diphosphate reductase alpha chain
MSGRKKANVAEQHIERGNRLIADYEPVYPSMPVQEAAVYEAQLKSGYEIVDLEDPRSPEADKGWIITERESGDRVVYSPNARAVTTKEYLRKDSTNRPTENVLDLCARVAVNIATAERKYHPEIDIMPVARTFMKRMIKREFVPNTPTYANAGGHLQQLAACFGMILEDYLGTDDIGEDPEKQGEGIFDIARYGAMIQKSGGGTGYNFSNTRPRNSGIATTGGRASGPVSWLRSFNGMTQEINQGGFRRGANMGVLEYWHPDIFEFLAAKANNKIPFFNLSMGTDQYFWNCFGGEQSFYLVSPRNKNTIPEE